MAEAVAYHRGLQSVLHCFFTRAAIEFARLLTSHSSADLRSHIAIAKAFR